jgi:hypothetical protein
MWHLWWKKGHWGRFSSRTSLSPANSNSTELLHSEGIFLNGRRTQIQIKMEHIFLLEMLLCCSVTLFVRQCLLLLSRRYPGIDTPYVCMYYMFRSIVAIIRHIEHLQPPFLLFAVLPCTDQCLRIGSAFYRCVQTDNTRTYSTFIFQIIERIPWHSRTPIGGHYLKIWQHKTKRTRQHKAKWEYIYSRRDSALGIATGYGLDGRGVGVRVPVGARIFTFPCRSDRLWGPPNLLSIRYRGSFPGGKVAEAWSWPLTSN